MRRCWAAAVGSRLVCLGPWHSLFSVPGDEDGDGDGGLPTSNSYGGRESHAPSSRAAGGVISRMDPWPLVPMEKCMQV